MSRLSQKYQQDGFYGIGLMHSVKGLNIGTLWRSAYILGASFIFTIGNRYHPQPGDVTRTWTKIPLFHHDTFEGFYSGLAHDTRLVGVEMGEKAVELNSFDHPLRAVYLLGNEQVGLSCGVMEKCHSLVKLPGAFSLNVAVAGSLVMYDRVSKISHVLPGRG
ncbi:MAG: RNA methyltransferase [Desulfobacterium sp.]|jgi:tRNA G18 (ribose-2'-O)-methylase SpoU|nr:RNA methyltransferase [Desulfobacterium sp.]